MHLRRKSFVIIVIFLVAGIVASSQTPGLDPALLAKANAGDTAAQISVGEKFVSGTDVAQDYKQAADWYLKAAKQGNVAGEIHLADLYRDGRGVTRDKTKAAEWYRNAAEEGDAGAQGTLAMLYSMGLGVEAYYWFDLAAAVKGPNQDRYIASRQNVGTRITVDDLAAVKERVAKWMAAHPR